MHFEKKKMLLPNYFNVGDTVNKPYFKKRWSVPLTLWATNIW